MKMNFEYCQIQKCKQLDPASQSATGRRKNAGICLVLVPFLSNGP